MGFFSLRRGRLVLACAPVLLAGCLPFDFSPPLDESNSGSEQVLGASAERPPAADRFGDLEPNDDFATAQPVAFVETVRLEGAIAAQSSLDVDVFDLGPAHVGDRVMGALSILNGSDLVLGVYDDRQRLLGYVDQSSSATGPREMDIVVREATAQLFAVVTTRSTASQDRAYSASISILRNGGIPSLRPQVVVLSFNGASQVRIGSRPPVDVPAFDAANISSRFAGQSESIIALIFENVAADFAGLNVSFYRAGDPAIPAGNRSVVHYGTYDSRLLGLADNIDPYNSDTAQSAILFTDTFSVFNALSPGVADIAQVLANTTSHEVGHLLGLRHTADPTDLMDTTATARQMLLDQDFSFASLNPSVLALGYQDAPSMLSWGVGGTLLPPPAGKLVQRQLALRYTGGPDDFYVPRSWLMTCGCAECDHEAEPAQ